MTNKKILLFDVDGVLVHGYHANPKYRICWDKDLKEDLGICPERFTKEFIFDTFRNVINGERDLKEALAEDLPKLGFHGDPQEVIDYWLKKDSNINTDLLQHIKALKETGKVRLFITTNQEHNRAEYLMKNMGFENYFEDIFHSARIGATKPSEHYYNKVTELLDLSSNEKPILFDDTPNVVEGAIKHGWEAVQFNTVDDFTNHPFIKSIL